MTTEPHDSKTPNEMTYAEKANHYANICHSQRVEIALLKSERESYRRALEQDEEIFRAIRAELTAEGIGGRVSCAAVLFHIRGRGDDPDAYEDEDDE